MFTWPSLLLLIPLIVLHHLDELGEVSDRQQHLQVKVRIALFVFLVIPLLQGPHELLGSDLALGDDL